MTNTDSTRRLDCESREATSEEVGSFGLQPAFEDTLTGKSYPSRFANVACASDRALVTEPTSLP